MRAKFQKRISQTLYTIQAVALEPPYQIVNADDHDLTWTFHRWEIAQWGRRPKSGGPALCCTLSRPVRVRFPFIIESLQILERQLVTVLNPLVEVLSGFYG